MRKYPFMQLRGLAGLRSSALLLLAGWGWIHFSRAEPAEPPLPVLVPTATLTTIDSLNCCYTLTINYQPDIDGDIDVLETNLVDAGALFSAINIDLQSGWRYEQVLARRRLRWTHEAGQLPTGEQTVFTFCIDGWNEPEPARLALRWRRGNLPVFADTLGLPCQGCLRPGYNRVECRPDSSYRYVFQFENTTGFAIHSLRIGETGPDDRVVETELSFMPPLAPGQASDSLALQLRPTPDSLAEVCFLLTPTRIDSSGLRLDCCTVEQCVDLPNCDRCCTDFDVFTNAVAEGYRYALECFYGADEPTFNLEAYAPGLNDCDLVEWTLDDLTMGDDIAGATTGNDPIRFLNRRSSEYALCMEVTRRNEAGEPCFGPDSTLVYCDTFFIECPCVQESFIDLDFECPPELTPVCGCDSMTYFNECAAANWSGVQDLEPGECPYPMPPLDTITLSVTPDTGLAVLTWTSTGTIDYRYFLVQRCLIPADTWETIGQTEGSVLTFDDVAPPGGEVKYRIIGVAFSGKYVISNTVIVVLVAAQEALPLAGLRIGPNPAVGQVRIDAPIPLQVTVFDALGRPILQLPLSAAPILLNTNYWPPGAYWLRLSDARGRTTQRRLIRS